MIRKYDDLDIWIDPIEGEGYRARAVHPSAGTASSFFQQPFSEQELQALFQEPRARHRDFRLRLPTGDEARRMGEALFGAVFSGQVRVVLTLALHNTNDRGLRIRLKLGSPELFSWPWELLHNSRTFLALSERMTIVRDLEHVNFSPVLRRALPLRVLVVVSNPPECAPLDGDAEYRHIEEALQPLRGWVRIERLQDPSRPKLRKSLKTAHILHFIGHGISGALILKGPDGRAGSLGAEEIAGLVGDSSVRLVVLNACWTAPKSLSGVAQRLVHLGIPAVLGMQREIDDRSAVIFAQALYEKLAEGAPVDGALTEARQAVRDANEGQSVEWAVPVLFLSSVGLIFRWWQPRLWIALLILLIATLAAIVLPIDVRSAAEAPQHPELQIPLADQDCPSLRSMDIPMALIPSGGFLMGSGSGKKEEENESPLHRVRISHSFCLGIYEVTQEQWERIMGPHRPTSKIRGARLPMTGISYLDIMEFLRRVNAQEGKEVVRLPTEAEWEYAAHSPGGGWNCLSRTENDGFDGLAPVGSFAPNRSKLYDILGNAWELVGDWYGKYPATAVTDPQGPPAGTKRVRRGGGFDAAEENCRATRRNTALKSTSRYKNTGFRIVRELKSP